jgi:L-2-hydroxyglutarate oxidase LhgO
MSDRIDCAIIGAGVVGLAIGRALAQAGREVVVIERNAAIGEETSSRNSEVVHAGLYYPPGSLKAKLCVSGRESLYTYCAEKRVPFQRCGKLVVATAAAQAGKIARIAGTARRNGVDDVVELTSAGIADFEPALRAAAALWSPSTGIVDSHALMLALTGDLEAADGIIATNTEVTALDVDTDAIRLGLRSEDEQSTLVAATVVNAAGLGAGDLASRVSGAEAYVPPKIRFAKGNYFVYQRPSPFHHLVYPLPAGGGLGIHATLDLAGRLRFGPDVEWIDEIDYTVDAGRREAFALAIREYWPEVDARALEPGYSGIRPKLAGPGEGWADFRVDVAVAGSRRQLIHLLGIESPGLTSALSLADELCDRLETAAR